MNEQQLWRLDLSTNIAVHKNGVTVTFEDGVVMDIECIPKSFNTTDIRNILRSARRMYIIEIKKNASCISDKATHGRPILTLKR